MNITQPDVVFVATAEQLSTPSYYRRLWLSVRNLNICRLHWMDVIADTLRDYDGVICYPNGAPYEIPDIDEVFGNDPNMRWFGYYVESDVTGRLPATKARKVDRLRLLDLYFKIQFPELARKFC